MQQICNSCICINLYTKYTFNFHLIKDHSNHIGSKFVTAEFAAPNIQNLNEIVYSDFDQFEITSILAIWQMIEFNKFQPIRGYAPMSSKTG